MRVGRPRGVIFQVGSSLEDAGGDPLMSANVELRIAGQLLQALPPQSGTREAAEREVDDQYALDLARILLRRLAVSL